MTIDDLMRYVLIVAPNATVSEDEDGQVIINTNMRSVSSDGHLLDMGRP